MQPRVVDLSHHNTVEDFRKAANAGIWGIIHKATQGTAYRDPDYAPRRKAAKAARLLWGAYHFNTGQPVIQQVDNFLLKADPDDSTLLALDYEDNRLSQMSIFQVVEFLHLIEEKTERQAVLYSGNRLKETIGALSRDDLGYLTSHRLWLAQYGPIAHLPPGFARWWLWQYTGDGVGPGPHTVPGLSAGNGGLDLNTFEGTKVELEEQWTG